MSKLIIVGYGGVLTLAFSSVILDGISQRHCHFGKKRIYKLSQWDNDVNDDKKRLIIENRLPILNVIKSFNEGKPFDKSSASDLFVDDALYDDPSNRCTNKEKFFNAFEFSLRSILRVEVTKFQPIHSQNCMHIAYEKETLCNNVLKQTVPRTGTYVVTLTKDADHEKIVSIIDEQNDVPLLTKENRKSGNLFILYRQMNVNYALFCQKYRNAVMSVWNKVKEYDDY